MDQPLTSTPEATTDLYAAMTQLQELLTRDPPSYERQRLLVNLRRENEVIKLLQEGKLDGLDARTTYLTLSQTYDHSESGEEWYLHRLAPGENQVFDEDRIIQWAVEEERERNNQGFRVTNLVWNETTGILGADAATAKTLTVLIFTITDSLIAHRQEIACIDEYSSAITMNLAIALNLAHAKGDMNGRTIRAWQTWLERQLVEDKDSVHCWKKCGLRKTDHPELLSPELQQAYQSETELADNRSRLQQMISQTLYNRLLASSGLSKEAFNSALSEAATNPYKDQQLYHDGTRLIESVASSIISAVQLSIDNHHAEFATTPSFSIRDVDTAMYALQDIYRDQAPRLKDYQFSESI